MAKKADKATKHKIAGAAEVTGVETGNDWEKVPSSKGDADRRKEKAYKVACRLYIPE